MNEKMKKRLKTIGIVTGGVVVGAGLMYIGYLTGADYFGMPGHGAIMDIRKSVRPEKYLVDLAIRKPLMPKGKCVLYGIDTVKALETAEVVLEYAKEVHA